MDENTTPVAPYLAVGLSTVVHGVGERKHIERLGQPPLDMRLRLLMGELAKAEAALQATPRVYR